MPPIKINVDDYLRQIDAADSLRELLGVVCDLLTDLSTDANLNRRLEFTRLLEAVAERSETLLGTRG